MNSQEIDYHYVSDLDFGLDPKYQVISIGMSPKASTFNRKYHENLIKNNS